MSKVIDITGQKFNNLTVIERLPNAKGGISVWKCLCDCGNYTTVRASNLKNGAVKSCGCLKHISRTKTHGETHTRLYSLWNAMKNRCNNPNANCYMRYGGRGIKVCDEWQESFVSFRDWSLENGYDETLSIDRIDNNKGYYPKNCRWVTFEQQCNNRRSNVLIEYKGETRNLMQWCKILNVDYKLVHNRMNKSGWNFEKSVSTPKLHK